MGAMNFTKCSGCSYCEEKWLMGPATGDEVGLRLVCKITGETLPVKKCIQDIKHDNACPDKVPSEGVPRG